MHFLQRLYLLIKRFLKVKSHSGAGSNTSFWGLIRRGLYYYFGNGYAATPLTLFFVINGRCNLKCKMCDVGQKNTESSFYKNIVGDKLDFPFEKYKKIILDVKKDNPYISLTTTEPLLYKDLVPLIQFTRENGLAINITTNGVLLDQRGVSLVDAGLNRLSVSIDGPPEVHDVQRGVPGTFERVVRGLKQVYEYRDKKGKSVPEIYITTTITPFNYDQLDRMVDALPMDKVDMVNMKLMVFTTKEMADEHNQFTQNKYPASENCLSGGISPQEIDIGKLIEQVNKLSALFPKKIHFHFEPDKKKLEQYFFRPSEFMDDTKCVITYFVAQLSQQGDLMVYTRCYTVNFGNVFEDGFYAVWNSSRMRQFRNELKEAGGRFPACSRCDGVLYR